MQTLPTLYCSTLLSIQRVHGCPGDQMLEGDFFTIASLPSNAGEDSFPSAATNSSRGAGGRHAAPSHRINLLEDNEETALGMGGDQWHLEQVHPLILGCSTMQYRCLVLWVLGLSTNTRPS